MNIAQVQWHHYRIPFRATFTTDHGVMTDREGIIVQITTGRDITGVGEIAPLPAFGGGSLAEANSVLPILVARLKGKTLNKALELVLAWGQAGVQGVSTCSAPVLCGLEIALLDALGKAEGCGVSTLLSPVGTVPQTAVAVNAVIGTALTGAAVAAAQEAVKRGFRCVKLKVGLGRSIQEEVVRVAAVRDAIGPALHLRLDANEAWPLEQAIAILSRCVPYSIQYVEQPLRAHDLDGMHTLRQAVPIPIAVDEALYGQESLHLIVDKDAADILVIKPQLAGGLRVGQQMMQFAAERGISSVITSSMEAGVGLVAALHLAAASPTLAFECGLATLRLLSDDLLLDDLPIRMGLMAVPKGPGLGVVLDRDALHRYSFRGGD